MAEGIEQLRIGFIGHGRHARANLYPALAASGVRLTALATRDESRAQAAAATHGAGRGYGDFRRMLAEQRLDAVLVSVAPEDQAEITEACLRAGAHVFAEKPLGLDRGEAARVAATAQQHRRQVMVGFMKRYAPAYRALARVVSEEQFGRIVSFNGFFAFSPWTPQLRDDSFLKLAAVHMVDLVRFLFGEVTEVAGFTNSQGPDISMVVSLRCANGVVGGLTFAAVPAWSREQEELTVTGRSGFVRVENLTRLVRHHHQAGDLEPDAWQGMGEQTVVHTPVNSPASGGLRDLYLRGFVGEIRHFLGCVAEERVPSSSAADNVATMALCDTILGAVRRV